MRIAAAILRYGSPSPDWGEGFLAAALSASPASNGQGGKLTSDLDMSTRHPAILVVEHNRFLRDMICDWLGGAGYTAHAAADAQDALAWLNRRRFDLMLLELDLPRNEGISLLGSVKSKLPRT